MASRKLAVRAAIGVAGTAWLVSVLLLMFAAGLVNLAWMAILAAVMTNEVSGRDGQRVAPAFGIALPALAGLAATGVGLGF